jgi:hypothetical protein
MRPSEDSATAFVGSRFAERIQRVVLDPDRYYIFTLAASGTMDRADELSITGRATREEQPFQRGQKTVLLSCWPDHPDRNGLSYLGLRVLPRRKHTDGPGKKLDYAWETYLTNARPRSGSMLTAVFYVDREGSVHEPGPDQLSRGEIDIDGEGRPRPPTASASTTAPNRLPH